MLRPTSAQSLFLALFLLVLGLTAATPIPALCDYLNHLARMHLLFDAAQGDPSPYYVVAWGFYPNLAMELVVLPLARWMGVEPAAALFVLLAQALVVTGALAMEKAVKGRFAIAGFVALLFIYSFPFARGFVGFQFGLGLALWGVACWLALREISVWARLGLHAFFVLSLFTAHFFALGVYGFTLGLYELWRFWRLRPPVGRFVGDMALLAAPAVLGAALLAGSGASGHWQGRWDWTIKPFWLLVAANGFNLTLSAAILAALVLMALRLRRAGAIRFEGAGGLLAAGFAALFLALPQQMQGESYLSYVDVRALTAAALILPAFIAIDFPDAIWRRNALLTTSGLILANILFTAWLWTSYRADYDAMIASFARLDRGAKIAVALEAIEDPFHDQTLAPMIHAPTLAAHYAKALAASLMAGKGRQPITPSPALEALKLYEVAPIRLPDLVAAASGWTPPDEAYRDWPRTYDAVYLIGPPTENPLPGLLREIAVNRRFTLYRVDKAAAAAPR
jgi:hypothetical protein